MSIPSYRRKLGGYWYEIQYRSKEVALGLKPVEKQEALGGNLKEADLAHEAHQFAETLSWPDTSR
jgi:hypothetical protein